MSERPIYAFPHWDGPSGECHNGMTLQDYFAAKIIPHVMDAWDRNSGNEDGWQGRSHKMASIAYKIADAMLAERAKT